MSATPGSDWPVELNVQAIPDGDDNFSAITIDLRMRDVEALLAAVSLARDQTVNEGWRWWHETKYANSLYYRLNQLAKVSR